MTSNSCFWQVNNNYTYFVVFILSVRYYTDHTFFIAYLPFYCKSTSITHHQKSVSNKKKTQLQKPPHNASGLFSHSHLMIILKIFYCIHFVLYNILYIDSFFHQSILLNYRYVIQTFIMRMNLLIPTSKMKTEKNTKAGRCRKLKINDSKQ